MKPAATWSHGRPIGQKVPLPVLFMRFAGLGLVAYGGPVAHMGMLEREAARRGWVDRESLLRWYAICSALPGPNSTQTVILLGRHLAGTAGGILAGLGFVLPGALLVAFLTVLQITGREAWMAALDSIIEPTVVAIIAVALSRFGSATLRTGSALAGCSVAVVLSMLAIPPPLAILAAGTVGLLLGRSDHSAWLKAVAMGTGLGGMAVTSKLLMAWTTLISARTPLAVVSTFLEMGLTAFGSGYVLASYMQWNLVDRLGWLTDAEVLHAVGLAHVAPGPLFTAAAAAGTLIGGVWVGVAASAAIFLPSFAIVPWIADRLASRLQQSPMASLTNAIQGGALGVMILVLARFVLNLADSIGAMVCCAAWILLLTRLKVSPAVAIGASLAVWVIVGPLEVL